MKEGRIAKWTKSVGDQVRAGDAVAEIETDKATVDFQVVEDGFLAKIFIESSDSADKMVRVGELIGVMVEEKSDISAFKDVKAEDILSPRPSSSSASPAAAESKPQSSESIKQAIQDIVFPSSSSTQSGVNESTNKSSSSSSGSSRVFASPLAKKTAYEAGIKLEDLVGRGSGPNGRVIKSDVIDFIQSAPSKSTQTSKPSEIQAQQQQQQKQDRPAQPTAFAVSDASFTDIPVSEDMSILAAQSVRSKREIPHYYLNVEIEINELLQLRDKFNANLSSGKEAENKLSLNDFIIRAVAISTQRVPIVNASWMGSFIRQYHNCNVNISVAEKLSNGRVVTSSILLKNVQSKGLLAISSESKDLASKLQSDPNIKQEIGTFTVTNLGAYGVKQYAPIIRQPQAVSLGVGSIRQIVVPAKNSEGKDSMKIQSLLPVTISCDHRVVDGAVSAQWLQHFRNLLQNPMTMLL